MDFAYCFDCREITYAVPNNNGVFTSQNVANNHFGHNQYIFGKPNEYCAPIRLVLSKLNAGLPIKHNEIVLFKLAIDLGELDKFIVETRRRVSKTEQTHDQDVASRTLCPRCEEKEQKNVG